MEPVANITADVLTNGSGELFLYMAIAFFLGLVGGIMARSIGRLVVVGIIAGGMILSGLLLMSDGQTLSSLLSTLLGLGALIVTLAINTLRGG